MSEASGAEEATGHGWFGPGVAGIGVASFLADVGHEVPTALLPSLLTSTIGAPASALGVIEGVSDALAGVARLGGGALADDPHRRRSVAVGGYASTAVLSAGLGAATTTAQVAVLRAGAWTARGLRVPARNALLADIVPAESYGRAYGFERAMDNLGAIVGPLLAIILVGAVGTRAAIGLSVIPGLLAALAIVYAIRHTAKPHEQHRRPIRLRIRPVLQGRLGRLMVGITAFEIGNSRGDAAHPASHRAIPAGPQQERCDPTRPASVRRLQPRRDTDQRPRRGARRPQRHDRVMAAGAAAFATAYVWFAVGPSGVLALLPAFVLAGVGIGCAETAEHAAVANLAQNTSEAPPSGSSPRPKPQETLPPRPSQASSGRRCHPTPHSSSWRPP